MAQPKFSVGDNVRDTLMLQRGTIIQSDPERPLHVVRFKSLFVGEDQEVWTHEDRLLTEVEGEQAWQRECDRYVESRGERQAVAA